MEWVGWEMVIFAGKITGGVEAHLRQGLAP